MPDITMCKNYRCPLRWDCARSASSGTEPNKYGQTYAKFPFIWLDEETQAAACNWEVPLDPDRPDKP